MKNLILLLSVILFVSFSFANWEDIITQEEQNIENEKVKILNENFKLEKFTYSGDFEKFLISKLYDRILENCQTYIYPLYRNEPLLKGFAQPSLKGENISSSIEYSKTNIQKENVDEPEILKLTQDYIAYYNKNDGKIYLIKSPVNLGKIDLDVVKITDTIKVPSLIYRNSVRLFFVKNQLIVMGTRYSQAFGGTVTDLVFYKIENRKAKFLRFYETRGNFKDARIVRDKIYLVTDYNFAAVARKICSYYVYEPLKEKITDLNSQFFKAKTSFEREKIKQAIQNIYKKALNNLGKAEILKQLEKYVKSKSIDIIFDKNARLKFGNKVYPLKVKVINSLLENILYMPINLDKLNPNTLRFSVVNMIDLNTGLNPNLYVFFGNIVNGQIHMTTKSLYLVNIYYENTSWKCRPGLYCILPIFPRGYFTLIHKLSLNGFSLNYINSQIVPGSPINQYSMDEDNNGNFRIFTKHYYPQRATDLYVFNKNLDLVGKIQNIAPGEDFKSSRFIEDKAYLVTFKATDPLFVIDLQNLSNPKILGELKIPGYSLYLHPLVNTGNVQYLLGIGQEAEEVHGNWSLPKNIKIDVYKIDYSKNKISNSIDFDEIKTKCLDNNLNSFEKKADSIFLCLKRNYSIFDYYEKLDDLWKEGQIPTYKVYRFNAYDGTTEAANKDSFSSWLTYISKVIKKDIKENKKQIYIKQIYSYTLGNEKKVGNGGSYTPVFDNPRTFVYDKDLKTLLLPVYLTEDKVEKRCYPKYIWENGQRIEDGENCYDYTKKIPYFIGIKGLKVDLEKGINEVLSKNYLDLYKGAGISLTKWKYKSETHRVSYYKNGSEFVPFEININFVDFFKGGKDKIISFSKLFSQQVDINSRCFYKKPAPGTITCQMYCGQRWVLENGKCVSIQINAACSCPGFDTKTQCEKECLR